VRRVKRGRTGEGKSKRGKKGTLVVWQFRGETRIPGRGGEKKDGVWGNSVGKKK